MSLYQLKSQFQDQLRPISDTLAKSGCSANQVTISAVILSLGTAYVIAKPAAHYQALWALLPSSLFVRMALNAIDGMMAREHAQASALGGVLNEAGDIIADTALISSLLPHSAQPSCPSKNVIDQQAHQQRHVFGLMILSVSTELIAIACDAAVGARANQGPLGKSDRAFVLGVLGAAKSLSVPISLSHRSASPFFMLIEILLLKTCLNRLRYMAALYLQRQPPVPRSARTTLESQTMSSDFININDTAAQDMPVSPSAATEVLQAAVIEGESCYNAYDGTAIYYRYWLTMPIEQLKNADQCLRQVILLHRGHEHSGRLAELGQQFAAAGYQVFAWDARGNGRSGGIKDHAESVTELERDLTNRA